MKINDYVIVLRNQWKLAVVVLLLTLLCGSLYVLASPRTYSASATLYISASGTSDSASAYEGGLLSEQRVKSYDQLFSSLKVAQEAKARLKSPDSIGNIAEKLSAQSPTNSTLITATAEGDTAQSAADLSNAAAESFVALIPTLENPQNDGAVPLIQASIVDFAVAPAFPSTPRPLLTISLALLVGLGLGVAAAIVSNNLDRRVKSEGSMAQAADAPALGSIALDSNLQGTLKVSSIGENHSAEGIKQIRTNLQFVDFDRTNQLIGITSANSGEGKTTTASNIAAAVAITGRRVLLIDADLRRPQLADYSNVNNDLGLSEALAAGLRVEDVAHKVSGGNLLILPSGAIPPNPRELLGSRNMRALLDSVRSSFDICFVDLPPILPVTDASVMASQLDAMVLTCRYGKTTTQSVARAAAAVRLVSGRVLGAVLTMSPAPRGSYDSYYNSPATHSRPRKELSSANSPVQSQSRDPLRAQPRPSPTPRSQSSASSDSEASAPTTQYSRYGQKIDTSRLK